nr:uncharacterized protein LOC112003887 [Quercus suber]
MHDEETLKAYSGQYWEMYNELEGNFDDVAISTLKNGLPTGHGLRKSLTGKPATKEDKIGTTQPYDDALVITLRIGDYDVRRVMVDDGNATEVMYLNLYKGLGLKLEDLTPYNSPLMSFDRKLVTPKGMIRLPIQTGPEVVEVNFIVVDTYFPYTAIVGREIEVDHDQIKAIHNLKPPQNPKEVQKLTGMIAALNRFISRSVDRCRPFYLLINKWKRFEWSEDCVAAFRQRKEYLSILPIMSNLEADEVLYAYIAVAPHAPVYYVSKSRHEAKVKYLPLEKAILVVIHATRKLLHYFQAHTVVVLTQLPLKSVLRTTDYTRRIAKWNTILGAFNIKYLPRTSIKGQVLADLVAKFVEPPAEMVAEERGMDGKSVEAISIPGPLCWKAYVDGATNQRGSRVGLVLVSPEKSVIEKSLRLGFSATNNEAEYGALLQGMVMVQKMGRKVVEMFSDSRLVVGQVKGELEARDSRMQEYLSQVKRLQSNFNLFSLSHVTRSGNTHADSLATLATSSVGDLPQIILVEHLERANEVAKGTVHIHQVGVGPNWMDPIVRFLKDDVLPEEKSKAEKIRMNASRFLLSEDHKLYRPSYSGPYLLCIHPEASELLLEELHKGICESHTEGRSLSHRAVNQGYWWPGM